MRNYELDPDTLLVEIKESPLKSKLFKGVLVLVGSLALAVLYVWVFTGVLGHDLPKTALLKAERTRWESRLEVMNNRIDRYEEALDVFQLRDDDIYRSLFGMDEITAEARNAFPGNPEKYDFLDGLESNDALKRTALRLDRLSRRTLVQSRSLDEVSSMSMLAGDMASCIPAVPPIVPDASKYQFSSRFGYRSDPFLSTQRMHTGVDFAMKVGNPVYATGDGVVETVAFDFFGYGNCIIIDHGFGYKTMYAHLSSVSVIEGMKVRRGELIAESGKSGRASGAHLHYEVIYRGNKVNPENYFDLSMPKDEYLAMVRQRALESGRGQVKRGFSVHRRQGGAS